MKRLLSALLALFMTFSLCSSVLAAEKGSFSNFRPVNTYAYNSFSDVSGWYSDYVSKAYTLGLMQGSTDAFGERAFKPNGLITLAETVTLAVRIHSIYYGIEQEFMQGSVWYQVYVDYAIENGILSEGEYTNFNQPATRAQFVNIIVKALPNEAYQEINIVEIGSIPDVEMDQKYALNIYKLYRAGVLTGGRMGAFQPDNYITRKEVAAIASRMVSPDLRQSFHLYAPLYVGFTLDANNKNSVGITGLTMTTENETCYLTIDFKSQESQFLSIMNASESLYILKVMVIDPGTEHFTFAFPMATLQEIYDSSQDPENEKLIMEFYSSGDPSSVTDRFYIAVNQFAKYFKPTTDA